MNTTTPAARAVRSPGHTWPLLLLSLPAGVAIWAGWVGLGGLTGFGVVHPLPGTPLAGWSLDTSITLPIGVETYAAYALRVWLAGAPGSSARTFARWSAIGSLLVGAAGQGAYHLMTALGITKAPWPIVVIVACLPVAVLGMGAALAHLVTHDREAAEVDAAPVAVEVADTPPVEAALAVEAPLAAPAVTSRPSTSTTPRRRPVDAATRVQRYRTKHPDASTADMARALGLSDRTVRRHLNTHAAPTAPVEVEGPHLVTDAA